MSGPPSCPSVARHVRLIGSPFAFGCPVAAAVCERHPIGADQLLGRQDIVPRRTRQPQLALVDPKRRVYGQVAVADAGPVIRTRMPVTFA